MLNITPYIKGMATFIPGLYPHLLNLLRPGRTGGTVSARYCYSVWLRHLVMAGGSGLSTQPNVVAELGPGDSLGIGIASLLTGAEVYYAFDVVRYASNWCNLQILGELIELFRRREPIPDEREFPEVRPQLASYEFPRAILTDERLRQALREDRLQAIHQAVLSCGHKDVSDEKRVHISYCVPWSASNLIRPKTVDVVFSQAVMEHVDNIESTHGALRQWIKPEGYVSHTIDFRSHGTAPTWNGHWGYSDLEWTIVRGRRPYLLNRQPHSAHLRLLQKSGFKVVVDLKERDTTGIGRDKLAQQFGSLSDDDLTTPTAFVQAVPVD